jgi:hypothetical protein
MERFTDMTSKLLSLGMTGVIAVAALALVSLLLSQTTAAQMMMMQEQMTQNGSPQQHEPNHNMFNVMGMSMVRDVRVTGVSITGNNTISVTLTHTGNATSPSVTIVAMTNHMAMMNMMMGAGNDGDYGGYHGGGMTMEPGMMTAPNMTMTMNNSGFPGMMMNPDIMMGSGIMMGNMDSETMVAMAGSHTGSTVVNSGWRSGNSTSITLEGDTSARDASDICVMVFPHLT